MGNRLEIGPAIPVSEHSEHSLENAITSFKEEPPYLLKNLVSSDGKTFAINVFLDSKIDSDRANTARLIVEMVDDSDAWVSGVPIFRTEVNLATKRELMIFIPLTIALVGGVLFLATGSFFLIGVALCASSVGTWLLLGTMGICGVQLSLSTMILPSIVLALGCAYVMHVFSAIESARGTQEIEAAIGQIAKALLLSGLTTAIGFVAISTVRIDAIRELGLFGAAGVLYVLLAVLSLVPSLLALLVGKVEFQFRNDRLRRIGTSFVVPQAIRNRRIIAIAWIGGAVISTIGIARVHVETDIILWFSDQSWIRESYENIKSSLVGITPVNVVIESENEADVTDPSVFRMIRELEEFVSTLPIVGSAMSFVDPVVELDSKLSMVETSDSQGFSAELISQYLLILGSIDNFRDLISNDRRAANISILLTENGSKGILGVEESVSEWWRQNGPSGFSATTTGIMYEFARSEEEISSGQARGFGLALISVAFLLVLIFREPGLIVATLVPNIVPLLLAYGFMGIAGIPLDAATMCLGSLSLGIAVDNTIHIATEFSDWEKQGMRRSCAIRLAVQRVIPALVFSTLAITVGFLVIGLSEFTLIRNLGLLTSAIVTVCLVADLTLLPALLSWLSSEGIQSIDTEG